MILASHNSWSYLTPIKWWQKLLFFTAKCQRKTIVEQYNDYNVRCFDLRIRIIDGIPYIVHNSFIYATLFSDYIMLTLSWLNDCGDVKIRIVHDVRREKDYDIFTVNTFCQTCYNLKLQFNKIQWWCGRNLYNWKEDYHFDYQPYCSEMYSSVRPPKIIDDWIPIIYAKLNNKKILKEAEKYEEGILMIDFVDIK